MTTKSLVKSLVGRLGYDIRKLPSGPAFAAQRELLRDREVSVVFDCGAYVGETVSRYRKLFPSARIHAFEPQPACFERLMRAHGDDHATSLHRLAVGGHSGSTQFYPSAWPTFSSILAQAPSMHLHRPDVPADTLSPIDVPAVTLDEFCTDREIDAIAVLKLDIQGAEVLALQGAESMLSESAVDLIYTEVNFVTLYESQAHFCDLAALLHRFDYSLYGLYDLGFAAGGFLSHADAIFLSPEVERSLLGR